MCDALKCFGRMVQSVVPLKKQLIYIVSYSSLMLPCFQVAKGTFIITNSPSCFISHRIHVYGIFTYIFTYIWLIFYGKSVGKYTSTASSHGSCRYWWSETSSKWLFGQFLVPKHFLNSFGDWKRINKIGSDLWGCAPQWDVFKSWFCCGLQTGVHLQAELACCFFAKLWSFCQQITHTRTHMSHVSPALHLLDLTTQGHMFWFLGLLKILIACRCDPVVGCDPREVCNTCYYHWASLGCCGSHSILNSKEVTPGSYEIPTQHLHSWNST